MKNYFNDLFILRSIDCTDEFGEGEYNIILDIEVNTKNNQIESNCNKYKNNCLLYVGYEKNIIQFITIDYIDETGNNKEVYVSREKETLDYVDAFIKEQNKLSL